MNKKSDILRGPLNILPEMITSVDYFITFTLKPHQYLNSVELQLEKAERELEYLYEALDAEGIVVFELTKNMNVHYHSILNFRSSENIIKRLKFYILDFFRKSKVIGFIDVQAVINYDKVLKYLFYDYEETKFQTLHTPIRYNRIRKREENEFGINHAVYITVQKRTELLLEIIELKKIPRKASKPIGYKTQRDFLLML